MLTVNGKEYPSDPPMPLRELLQQLQLTDQPCAVEVNEALVPYKCHATHILHDGDTVEIVTLVGGG